MAHHRCKQRFHGGLASYVGGDCKRGTPGRLDLGGDGRKRIRPPTGEDDAKTGPGEGHRTCTTNAGTRACDNGNLRLH